MQKGRDDVILEFPHDDTGRDDEDALFEMSFNIPKENQRYTDGEEKQPVEVREDSWSLHLACLEPGLATKTLDCMLLTLETFTAWICTAWRVG